MDSPQLWFLIFVGNVEDSWPRTATHHWYLSPEAAAEAMLAFDCDWTEAGWYTHAVIVRGDGHEHRWFRAVRNGEPREVAVEACERPEYAKQSGFSAIHHNPMLDNFDRSNALLRAEKLGDKLQQSLYGVYGLSSDFERDSVCKYLRSIAADPSYDVIVQYALLDAAVNIEANEHRNRTVISNNVESKP